MRILLLNPNTSVSVTEMLAVEARRVAGDTAEIRAVTAPSGVPAIQSEEDARAVARVLVETIAANVDCDAAIIGGFADPGLDAARRAAPIPVVGLGQSGILAASAAQRPFAIISVGESIRAGIERLVAGYGAREWLVAIRLLPGTLVDLIRDRMSFVPAIEAAAAACIQENGAAAILLGGGPFAGLAEDLNRRNKVPILDGVAAAVSAALREIGKAGI